MVSNMKCETFNYGEPVITYGDDDDKIYILIKGGISVFEQKMLLKRRLSKRKLTML